MSNAPAKPHPFRKTAARQITFGVVFLAVGVCALPISVVLGGAIGAIGAFMTYWGAYSLRHSEAVLINNAALDLVGRGRVAEAEALLAGILSKSGSIGRAVEIQRALIAFRRADLAASEAHATAALATRSSLLTRDQEMAQSANARAIRALARAAAGKEAAALEDIAAVRASPAAGGEALARATVAETIALARNDDRAALARIFATAHRTLDYAGARERALFRAIRRMVEARAGSAYREASPPADTPSEEPMLGAWVSKIVPGAGAFVAEAPRRAETHAFDASIPDSFPVGAGSASIARRTMPLPRRFVASVAGGVVAVGLFVALVDLFIHSTPQPIDALFAWIPAVGVVLGLAFFARIYRAIAQTKKGSARLRAAQRALVTGGPAAATALFADIVQRGQDATAAAAQHMLAVLAEKRGAFKEALALCDAALARVSHKPQVRALNSDLLVPELIAERAFLLAALDRDQQAIAELATLAREHPTFAFLTRSIFRVRLVQALRRSDDEAAVAVARERTPELPLSRRDEMLADIVLLRSGSTTGTGGERLRIAAELTEDPELADWLDVVAPGTRAAIAVK